MSESCQLQERRSEADCTLTFLEGKNLLTGIKRVSHHHSNVISGGFAVGERTEDKCQGAVTPGYIWYLNKRHDSD